ncbi:MAG: HIT family protein [Phycisphaerales bacterium]|nr:HIT family protein [Phycisphaerales bacterium]
MQDSDCVFCKIVQGGIPAFRIWETDDCLAFLDAGPLADGHTLLIPKHHCQDLRDVPIAAMGALSAALPGLASAVMRATNASGLNLLQNTGPSSGQVVPHLHFHLIPRIEGDELGYRWNAGRYEKEQAEAIRARIVHELDC